MSFPLYTVGHSNHELAAFLALLRQHGITAVADVRSHPYSRYVPQYSREPLTAALAEAGIAYLFLGKELGARSDNPACYCQGRVQYDRLSQEPHFAQGIRRVVQGMERDSLALLCAEKDPLDCHRALLVARKLSEADIPVSHIHADGALESHRALESRLLAACKLPERDLFTSRQEFVAEAYAIQAARVAYRDQAAEEVQQVATP
jgi:uncharacterized protein (DUF488 family)